MENNPYRRQVKAEKLELQKSYSKNSIPSLNEDQLNQTFERLVSDAKKRLLVQEEQERVKILKEQELDKKLERERSQSNYYYEIFVTDKLDKMSREAEERMVSKFVAEAERRKLKFEKTQLLKQEEEERQVN